MAKLLGLGDNVIDCNYTRRVRYPGGNCVNFAVFGRQIGNETAYVGKIANDQWGRMLLKVLQEEGIDCSKCIIEDGETGICGIHLQDGDRVIVDENDAGLVKANPLVITEDLLNYIKKFDLVHSSCYSYIEEELIKIKNAGIPVLYDFSDEWTDDKLQSICKNINIAFFSGKDLDEECLKDYLAKCVDSYGCYLAITTIGGRGAIVYNGRKFYRKLPYNFAGGVIDTTGAGDSWITGFISSYIDNMKKMEILKKNSPDNFLSQSDVEDFEDHVIEQSMCLGNLLARRNCLVEGSFGKGSPF